MDVDIEILMNRLHIIYQITRIGDVSCLLGTLIQLVISLGQLHLPVRRKFPFDFLHQNHVGEMNVLILQ